MQSHGSLFLFVVLTVVRAKCFSEPVALPPRSPSHLFTDFITVVDTESRNAASFVEPGCPLHDVHFFVRLLEHPLHTRELKLIIYKPSQPLASQLCSVQVRDTLDVSHKCHVWNQRINCSPDMETQIVIIKFCTTL